MLAGQSYNSIDDKGRLLIPSRVRNEISGTSLIITRGVDQSLWLFTPGEWERFSGKILEALSPLSAKARMVQLRLIAPAQELQIDKAGRVNLPPSLMQFAGLKKECVILDVGQRLELWDAEAYTQYLDSTEEDFHEAVEEIGELMRS